MFFYASENVIETAQGGGGRESGPTAQQRLRILFLGCEMNPHEDFRASSKGKVCAYGGRGGGLHMGRGVEEAARC